MLIAERPTRGHGLLEGFLADGRARMANSLIPRGHRSGRVLDIGCGSFPTFLAGTSFAERWGVDQLISSGIRIELADGHVDLLPYDANGGGALPFAEGMFSVVTMLAVFEHIAPDRLVPVLTEVHRVLAPAGTFIMTTPAHWTGTLLSTMARLKLVSPQEILEHKGSYSHSYILARLGDAGFMPGDMRAGSFEFFANNWVTATKSGEPPF